MDVNSMEHKIYSDMIINNDIGQLEVFLLITGLNQRATHTEEWAMWRHQSQPKPQATIHKKRFQLPPLDGGVAPPGSGAAEKVEV
ncbi:hypothetical protein INR49_005443 [Caranx melampygus]|nr:hypothetical protein INR49_005443 [Caranx melampygus]